MDVPVIPRPGDSVPVIPVLDIRTVEQELYGMDLIVM